MEKEIKAIFKENIAGVELDTQAKERLVNLRRAIRTLSPWQRFLDKEICIPLSVVPITAGVMVMAIGFFLNSLILPGDIPQPKYEIIEYIAYQGLIK